LDAGADACKNPPPCSEVERPKSNLTLATKIQEEPKIPRPGFSMGEDLKIVPTLKRY